MRWEEENKNEMDNWIKNFQDKWTDRKGKDHIKTKSSAEQNAKRLQLEKQNSEKNGK